MNNCIRVLFRNIVVFPSNCCDRLCNLCVSLINLSIVSCNVILNYCYTDVISCNWCVNFCNTVYTNSQFQKLEGCYVFLVGTFQKVSIFTLRMLGERCLMLCYSTWGYVAALLYVGCYVFLAEGVICCFQSFFFIIE